MESARISLTVRRHPKTDRVLPNLSSTIVLQRRVCVCNVLLPDFTVEIPSTTKQYNNTVVVLTDVLISPNRIQRLKLGRFKHFTIEYLDFYVTFDCNKNVILIGFFF